MTVAYGIGTLYELIKWYRTEEKGRRVQGKRERREGVYRV